MIGGGSQVKVYKGLYKDKMIAVKVIALVNSEANILLKSEKGSMPCKGLTT